MLLLLPLKLLPSHAIDSPGHFCSRREKCTLDTTKPHQLSSNDPAHPGGGNGSRLGIDTTEE